jgi:hypothetical protein
MMTAGSGVDGLLRELLNRQVEDGRGAELTEKRVREVVSGRDVFTAEEERLLLTSPLARSTYAEVQAELQRNSAMASRRNRRADELARRGSPATLVKRILSSRTFQLAAACAALVFAVPSLYQQIDSTFHDPSIYTANEKGAYQTLFCPPLRAELAINGAGGYECTPTRGTLDSLNRLLQHPTDIAFGQLDVYANESMERGRKLTLVRTDIACEGLWMVTKNPELKNYGAIQGLARGIHFILPERTSGSAPTFAFLQKNDPTGLGQVPETNKRFVNGATEVLNETAASKNGDVGFFVQFADPENHNIKLIAEKGLTVIPVVSDQILEQNVNGQAIYRAQEFNLRLGAAAVRTTCTPVVAITGAPETVGNANAGRQRKLIQTVKGIPAEKLLPDDKPLVADVIRLPKILPGPVIAEMIQEGKNTRHNIISDRIGHP